MFILAHGYPVTGGLQEGDSSGARQFRFKAQASERGPRRRTAASRWESVLTRSLNALHPHARIRFADPFLLRAPVGRRRSLRGQGLRAPVGMVLALDPVLPGGARCADCAAAAACAGEPLSYGALARRVRDARALGTRLFLLLARNPVAYRQEIVDLALRQPDCAFLLLSPRAVTEESFLQDLAEAGNAALVLSVDGFAQETDALHGPGAYDCVQRSLQSARAAGLPFGFAACCSNGHAPVVFSRGFLEGLIENGALFGLYYPCPDADRPERASSLQLRDAGLRLQGARERYPIPLIELRQDVTFRCLEAGERLPLHWTGAGALPLTLLESLELGALGLVSYPGDAAHRDACPRRTDLQWPKTALGAALADPQGGGFFSLGESSNTGQCLPVAR